MEYISRDAALACCKPYIDKYGDAWESADYEAIEALPLADVRENKYGRWIPSELDENYLVCSVCKSGTPKLARAWKKEYADIFNFCPICGAFLRDPIE